MVIVEALKNIAGISYFPDYFSYNDLNLRKHQAQHCVQATSSMLSAAPSESASKAEAASHSAAAPSVEEPEADVESGDDEE